MPTCHLANPELWNRHVHLLAEDVADETLPWLFSQTLQEDSSSRTQLIFERAPKRVIFSFHLLDMAPQARFPRFIILFRHLLQSKYVVRTLQPGNQGVDILTTMAICRTCIVALWDSMNLENKAFCEGETSLSPPEAKNLVEEIAIPCCSPIV